MPNLTNPYPYVVQKRPSDPKERYALYEVLFTYEDGKTQLAYMTAMDFRQLELGRKLQAKLTEEELKEIDDLLNDYGQEQYWEGYHDHED